MTVPAHSRYVIIGAGIHGLSTGWHLATGTAPPRPRRRRGHRRPRQDRRRRGRVRHRVRGHPQQLLPARHARADGALGLGLGVGPRGVRLSPGRLHADRAGGDARRRREDLRRAAGDRLPVRAHRGGAGLPRLHARHVRRLAGPRHLRDPARGEGRLRQQRPVAAGPGREGGGRGRADRRRASASPAWTPAAARSPRWRPTRARCDATSSSSRPGRGSATCGRCWTCPARSRSHPRPAPCTDSLGRCGPTGRCRRGRWPWTPASSPTTGAGSRRCCTSIPARRCTTT